MKKFADYKLMPPAHACVQAPSTNVVSAAISVAHTLLPEATPGHLLSLPMAGCRN
jgi:hypothetical protein